MTDFGQVRIGRLGLREAYSAAAETANGSARPLGISGQEAVPVITAAALARAQDDILGLPGELVPVIFADKASRSGYYRVVDTKADLVSYTGELVTCTWQVNLARVGTDTDIDLESRLAGALTRNNSFTATGGERWHCPPPGHYAYATGAYTPPTLTRASEDGALTVYRALPTGIHPRWGCPVGSYLPGRARFVDADGFERSGTSSKLSPAGWTLSNGLVRVTPSSTTGNLLVAQYSAGAWQTAKRWSILLGGVGLSAAADAITLLHNQPEMVVQRLLWNRAPGRVTVDLTLRRGARMVEVYVQTGAATTIKVVRTTAVAATAGTGYVISTAADTAGDKYMIASTRTVTADTAAGGMSVSASASFDCALGAVVQSATAPAGDTAEDLFAQYLGAPAETVQGVLR